MARRLNTPEFNKTFKNAFSNAYTQHKATALKNRSINNRSKEMIKEGVDPHIAKLLAKAERLSFGTKGGKK